MREYVDIEVKCPHCGEAYLFNPPTSAIEYKEVCDECDNTFIVHVPSETTRAPTDNDA